jgi:hypothetical protein
MKCATDPAYFMNSIDMEKYVFIIEFAISENRKKERLGTYYEGHHIVPKCLGGSGESYQWKNHDNIVLLTSAEHFECHLLLHKIFPNNKKLFYALSKMIRSSNNQSRFIPNNDILDYIKKTFSKKVSERCSIPINEYTRDGIYVRTWPSSYSVELELGIPHSNIKKVISGKYKTAGNRIWRLKEENEDNKLSEKEIQKVKNSKLSTPKSILQFDINNNFLKKYKSSYNAAKELNLRNANIIKVCNGSIKKTGGFYFKYEQ